MAFWGSIEMEDPENEDPKTEDLRKRRLPTKTKSPYENEDPFILFFVGNDFVGNEIISI